MSEQLEHHSTLFSAKRSDYKLSGTLKPSSDSAQANLLPGW